MDDYDRGSHSKYSLKLHITLVTKYRRGLLADIKVDRYLKEMIYECLSSLEISTEAIESDIDHIHLLIQYRPHISVSTIIRNLKSYRNYHLWKKYPDVMRRYYWKRKNLWSDGYFACSIGQVSADTIRTYIENQG